MVKTGDFKMSSKGVVQVEAGKGSDESVAPSDDNDVEKFVDFVGVQELNVGKSEDDPTLKMTRLDSLALTLERSVRF